MFRNGKLASETAHRNRNLDSITLLLRLLEPSIYRAHTLTSKPSYLFQRFLHSTTAKSYNCKLKSFTIASFVVVQIIHIIYTYNNGIIIIIFSTHFLLYCFNNIYFLLIVDYVKESLCCFYQYGASKFKSK